MKYFDDGNFAFQPFGAVSYHGPHFLSILGQENETGLYHEYVPERETDGSDPWTLWDGWAVGIGPVGEGAYFDEHFDTLFAAVERMVEVAGAEGPIRWDHNIDIPLLRAMEEDYYEYLNELYLEWMYAYADAHTNRWKACV